MQNSENGAPRCPENPFFSKNIHFLVKIFIFEEQIEQNNVYIKIYKKWVFRTPRRTIFHYFAC